MGEDVVQDLTAKISEALEGLAWRFANGAASKGVGLPKERRRGTNARMGRSRGPKSGTDRYLVPQGTWVELECTILAADERAPGIPGDTASHPFEGRVRGFLMFDAETGSVAQVLTPAGRVVHGNLRLALPRNPADFGNPAPELLAAGSEMRARLRGARES